MSCLKLILALLTFVAVQSCTASQSVEVKRVESKTEESMKTVEKKPSTDDQNEDEDISVPGEIVGDGKPIDRDGMISTPEYIGTTIYPSFDEAMGKKFEGFEFEVCEKVRCSKEEKKALETFALGDFPKSCKAHGFKLIFMDCCGPSWCTGLPEKGN